MLLLAKNHDPHTGTCPTCGTSFVGAQSMSNQDIVDAAFEAWNALSIAWHLANFPEKEKREALQAPINAGIAAMAKLVNEHTGKDAPHYVP